jgi:uncharacterized membrane protein YvbJ
MIMKICPNCLVGVSRSQRYCHQCGGDINRRSANRSQNTISQSGLFKSTLVALLWVALVIIGYVSIV